MKTGLIYLLMLTSVITHAQQQPRLVLPVGHTSFISSASFSPDGKYVVTASLDKSARIWEASTGKSLHHLEGHTDDVNTASFSPDGKYVVSASKDHTARIWETSSGKSLHQLKGHTNEVSSASFSPDGKYVVTSSYDGKAMAWKVSSGKQLYILEGHTDKVHLADFSHDGKFILTASEDSTARIWDAFNGKEIHRLGHQGQVFSANFSFDGKFVVTVCSDSAVIIWDAFRGNEIHRLSQKGIWISAEFSPDSKYVITGSVYEPTKIWDVSNGNELHNLGDSSWSKVSFSSDGKYAITGSFRGIARIWDVSNGKELHNLSIQSPVECASFSPDGKYVVTGDWDNKAKIWDASSGKEFKSLQGHTGHVYNSNFSPDGKFVMTLSLDNANEFWDGLSTHVSIWNAFSGKEINFLPTHKKIYNAAFSPDGEFFMIMPNDSTAQILELSTGKLLHQLEGHLGKVNSVSFSTDGKYLSMASNDSTARIWEFLTGKLLYQLEGHLGGVNSALFSKDGKYVVTASDDNTARIWEMSTGKILHQLEEHLGEVNLASFSPDGKYIVTASDDSTARIWDVSTGKILHQLDGHLGEVNSASFSTDGKCIVTASDDSTARIWDVSTGKILLQLEGHLGEVNSASFSKDGKYLVTVPSYFGDRTVRIWDTYTGNILSVLNGHYEMNLSSDGKKIITTGDDHKTIIWDFPSGKQLYTRLQLDNDDWLIYDEDYHFDGTPGAIEKLYFTCGLEVIDLGQLKDSLWIPGLAEKIMENQPLLINDKPAPKLSNLNICDLTPVIEQLEPDKDSKKLRFRITPRNGGLGATEVYINNNLTYTYQPNQLEQQTENKKKVYYLNLHTDTLKGYLSGNRHTPNPLLVKSKVKGSGIYSRGVEVTISNDLDKEESPAFYGVFVGVNDYGNSDGTNENKYRNLKMAAKDAEDLASAVEATARNLFKDSTHIYRITGNNGQLPTREVLQKTLDEIGKKAKASDILYIFFAGHGDIKQLKGEEQIRFMLYRADKINPETSSFGVQDLMEWCRPSNIKAQKRVFVFDACHSGKFSQEFAFGRGDDDGARIRQLDKLKDKNGMMILAASAENESAYEDETLNQGVLTYNLLQVMQTQKKDSSLIVRDWFDETIKLVEEYSRANGNRQHPNSFGDGRFEIGNINEQVRKTIQITAPKIRIGECVLVASDDLSEKEYPGLEEKLNAVFRNTTRGDGFVYSELKSKSYSIKGTYTSSKKQFNLRYKLYFGDQSVGNPVTLVLDKSKSTDDIVVEIEKSIRENIRKLK